MLAERIERHVEEMIEKSFAGGFKTGPGQSARWAAVGLVNLVLAVAALVFVVWLVKAVLF